MDNLKSLKKAYNAWYHYMNPLRNLTKPQIDQMFDQIQRGNDVRIQMAFYEMERTMPIYGIVLSKRLCGITKRQWTIDVIEDTKEARKQQKTVQRMFERANMLDKDGLMEAIRHLGLASFRGRSCVKPFINKDGKLYFKKLQNWNVLDWENKLWWNPKIYEFWEPNENKGLIEIPEYEICCVREERPIDIPGIQIYLRQLVGEEQWARAVEKYGIAQVVITAPDGTPDTSLETWRNRALQIFEGGSGVLPPGAKVDWATEVRNQDPFSKFCQHQMEVIALLALGGSLSTVGGSTGLGSNLAEVQNDQFESLVTYDCARIANSITNIVVKKCVDTMFPGDEQLVRFTFTEKDATKASEYLNMANQLASLGIKIDIPKLKEVTGIQFISENQDDQWTPGNIQQKLIVDNEKEWTPQEKESLKENIEREGHKDDLIQETTK